MIRPLAFNYNVQTAVNNHYQNANDFDSNFTDNVPAQLIKISQVPIVFLNFLIIFFMSFGFLKSHTSE